MADAERAAEAERHANPIVTDDQHRQAVDELAARLADTDAAQLALEIERVLRFELEHDMPGKERLAARLAALTEPPARRTALIADIHGNLAALLAALDDIGRQDCDRILCLGDLVDGGPLADEGVVETLVRLAIPCVRGNHDEINDAVLSETARRFLLDLPERIVEGDVLFTHISPRPATRVVKDEIEAWNVFEEHDFRLIFLGHAHLPNIFGKRSASFGEATRHEFEYDRPFSLANDDSYIVSIGSIWYGRDTERKVRYAIYDCEAGTVELRAIDEAEGA